MERAPPFYADICVRARVMHFDAAVDARALTRRRFFRPLYKVYLARRHTQAKNHGYGSYATLVARSLYVYPRSTFHEVTKLEKYRAESDQIDMRDCFVFESTQDTTRNRRTFFLRSMFFLNFIGGPYTMSVFYFVYILSSATQKYDNSRDILGSLYRTANNSLSSELFPTSIMIKLCTGMIYHRAWTLINATPHTHGAIIATDEFILGIRRQFA